MSHSHSLLDQLGQAAALQHVTAMIKEAMGAPSKPTTLQNAAPTTQSRNAAIAKTQAADSQRRLQAAGEAAGSGTPMVANGAGNWKDNPIYKDPDATYAEQGGTDAAREYAKARAQVAENNDAEQFATGQRGTMAMPELKQWQRDQAEGRMALQARGIEDPSAADVTTHQRDLATSGRQIGKNLSSAIPGAVTGLGAGIQSAGQGVTSGLQSAGNAIGQAVNSFSDDPIQALGRAAGSVAGAAQGGSQAAANAYRGSAQGQVAVAENKIRDNLAAKYPGIKPSTPPTAGAAPAPQVAKPAAPVAPAAPAAPTGTAGPTGTPGPAGPSATPAAPGLNMGANPLTPGGGVTNQGVAGGQGAGPSSAAWAQFKRNQAQGVTNMTDDQARQYWAQNYQNNQAKQNSMASTWQNALQGQQAMAGAAPQNNPRTGTPYGQLYSTRPQAANGTGAGRTNGQNLQGGAQPAPQMAAVSPAAQGGGAPAAPGDAGLLAKGYTKDPATGAWKPPAGRREAVQASLPQGVGGTSPVGPKPPGGFNTQLGNINTSRMQMPGQMSPGGMNAAMKPGGGALSGGVPGGMMGKTSADLSGVMPGAGGGGISPRVAQLLQMLIGSGLWAGGGAALAPKGHRMEGAGRGLGHMVGTSLGTAVGGLGGIGGGALLGSTAGKLLVGQQGMVPGGALGAGLGGLAGMLYGGVKGFQGAGKLMGKPSWRSKEAGDQIRQLIVKKAALHLRKEAATQLSSYIDKVAHSYQPAFQTGLRATQIALANGKSLGRAVQIGFPKLASDTREKLARALVKAACSTGMAPKKKTMQTFHGKPAEGHAWMKST